MGCSQSRDFERSESQRQEEDSGGLERDMPGPCRGRSWESKHSGAVGSREQELCKLLTFLRCSEPIRRIMYTANLTERTVKEMKKGVKAMRALPLIGASSEVRLSKGGGSFNGRRSNGVVNGFLEAGEEPQGTFF